MPKIGLFSLVLIIIFSCNQKETQTIEKKLELSIQNEETLGMTKELKTLAKQGDPSKQYHQNKKLAAYYQARIKEGTPQQQIDAWFEFCKQSLYAGESQLCIDELEGYLKLSNKPFNQMLNSSTKSMFELLALAYLRLGEQENCQNNHSSYVCILPLQKEGQHQIKKGSQKAMELYALLLSQFPDEKHQWLYNLAAMTLGEHPEKTLAELLISFPNAQYEQGLFPSFKESAMERGLAVNGLSGGVCMDDFNGDNHLDIFTTSYGMQDQSRLFLNDGNGKYTEATKEAGLEGIVSGLNCIHADYNNDGHKDIFVLRGAWLGAGGKHPNSLLKNKGDGTFEDVTRSSGLLSYHPTQTAAWADFNKDGYLDLFIGNEGSKEDPNLCELFQNNGDGTFTNVAQNYGLNIIGYVKGVTWGDFNNDSWPDLYVSILLGRNLLFKNTGGKFVEVGKQAGVQEPELSFPTWFFDVNNDGFLDLFVSGYDVRYLEDLAGEFARELKGLPQKGKTMKLYINNGDETFTDASEAYGIDKAIYTMGCNFGDLDNDGWLDFYLGTGAPDLSTVVPNRMFRNVNGNKFEEVTSAGNFGHIQKGHGVAFGDIDADGDQDIYMVLGGAYEGDTFTNILYENPISENNWITIELRGTKTNRSAIGSRIEIELDNGRKIYRTVSTGGSFGSSSLQQEIGLGKTKSIKKLTVYWQSGETSTFEDHNVNTKVVIEE